MSEPRGLTKNSSGWVFASVATVFKDGSFSVGCGGILEPEDLLPDHPALPGIARFLVSVPELETALTYAIVWLNVAGSRWRDDDAIDDADRSVVVLRGLVAALHGDGGA